MNMLKGFILAASLVGTAMAQVSRNAGEAKLELLDALGELESEGAYVTAEFEPLLFLWISEGRAPRIRSLEDLAALVHRIDPTRSTDAVLNELSRSWTLHMERELAEVARTNAGLLSDSRVGDAQTLSYRMYSRLSQIFNAIGVRVGSTHYAYTAESQRFYVKLLTSEGGEYRFHYAVGQSRFVTMTFTPEFNLSGLGHEMAPIDDIQPAVRGLLRSSSDRTYGVKLVQYMLQKRIAYESVFSRFSDGQFLRLFVRDELTCRYLSRRMSAAAGRGEAAVAESLRTGVVRARNVRYGAFALLLGGVATGGYFAWQEFLSEEDLLDQHLEKSVGMLPAKPAWDLKGYLREVIAIRDLDALRQTILGMGDEAVQALWNYVFVHKDE